MNFANSHPSFTAHFQHHLTISKNIISAFSRTSFPLPTCWIFALSLIDDEIVFNYWNSTVTKVFGWNSAQVESFSIPKNINLAFLRETFSFRRWKREFYCVKFRCRFIIRDILRKLLKGYDIIYFAMVNMKRFACEK